MRKIPFKNYVIAFILTIVTFFITIFFVNYYNDFKKYNKNERMSIIKSIDLKSLDNYIVENHEVIIYMSDSNSLDIVNFENSLRKLIIAKEYEKNILYFDLSNVKSDFGFEFTKKYFSETLIKNNVSLNVLPNVLIIKEGKVQNILYQTKSELVASDVIKFITGNIE